MALSAKPNAPIENRLLAVLSDEDYAHLLPHLEPLTFALGEVVYEPGGHLDYLYFPTSCIVSLVYTMEDGSTAEMGLVGNDGVVGIALFMGGETTPNGALFRTRGAPSG